MANIEDNNIDWKVDCERLILFADIMGFKDRVITTEHSILHEDLSNFMEKLKRKMTPLKSGDYLRYSLFSDSIVIVANGTSDKMLNLITKASICLMHSAMSNGFPIKGAIAKGLFTYDTNMQLFFGKSLVDAYLLQEELFYYGIVAHHSVEPLIKKCSYDLKYTKSLIPLKKGRTSHYHLSWQFYKRNLSKGASRSMFESWLCKIEETVSGNPRVYIDNTREVFSSDAKTIEKGIKKNKNQKSQSD